MTPEDVELVQSTFEKVRPISQEAAGLFYGRLFEVAPEVKPLFKGDMAEQGRKLMKMLSLVVNSLDRLDELKPIVQKMGERHAMYGAEAHHYDTVAGALLWTLEQGLGDAFTPETRIAWVKAYTFLATTMLEAAARVTIEIPSPAQHVYL